MTLSNSRQQFLAYETQAAEDIQYGRKGGVFISHCICATFIIFAIIIAVIVGVIVHFITYFKLSHQPVDFWDETEPFGLSSSPSPDLRLPSVITPSFYRLKLITDLENSTFTGDVSITIRASRSIREIILHSKNLSISNDARLTEQIYEKVDTLRSKRDVSDVANETTITTENSTSVDNVTSTDEPITTTLPSEEKTTVTETVRIENVTTSTTTEAPKPITEKTLDTVINRSAVRSIKILSIVQASGDRIILTLDANLKPNVDYILQLSFEGNISNSLTGFYKSSYTNNKNEVKYLGVTQFEPTSARSAFPCFDEPAFKAKFEISIAHPETITALSNMRIVNQEPVTDRPGWLWTHFDRSVKMSTYLVAYVLSDFKALETSYVNKNNVTVPIKVWTRPEFVSKAKYATLITPKLLAYYEEVFGVPYALDKMDLIAIPDFSSGAMENWGLITFRETTLLFDETQSVPREKQDVAIGIAHELAHQWFGNLVTMRWWTDLWLNEGFATYIEYVGVDYVEPEWRMFESFSRDKMDLLRSDALKNTSPVSRKVVDASEISQKFDEISYTKGANLIRMLNHTITKELFQKGLVIYLDEWKYSNAEENDLWAAMSKATQSDPTLKGLSLVEFMNSWTRQAGYPVVNVHREYTTNFVEFEQQLFSAATDPYKKMVNQLWQIPLTYEAIGTNDTFGKSWLNSRVNLVKDVKVNASQALYVNVGAIGYYRVNYDQRNWQLLSEALKSGQVNSSIIKSQLIDDAFNLAKVGQLNYSYALGLTTCVMNGEDSKMVWDQLLNNMAFLRFNLRATSGYVYFQDYVRKILAKQLERLNYGLTPPKDDNEAFLIEDLVTWECYVEAPRCLKWAREQFLNWTKQDNYENNPIPSYLRSLIYNMAVLHGGREEFEFLWNVFVNSSDPNVKSLIINNLPSTREESLITTLLEKSLTEIPKQYAAAAWTVNPPFGTRLAQDFLINNFDQVYAKFTDMDSFTFPAVVSGAFGFITTEEELARLKSFAMKNKDKLVSMSQTLQKLVDTATFRINWLRKHAAGINQWFKNFSTGNTNNTVSTEPNTTTVAQSPSEVANTTVASEPATTPTSVDTPQTSDNTTVSDNTTNVDDTTTTANTTNAASETVPNAAQETTSLPTEETTPPSA